MQIDGVMMGSSLGPTFANYYMSNLEENAFKSNPGLAPRVYARYVDDIFLVVNSNDEIQESGHILRIILF